MTSILERPVPLATVGNALLAYAVLFPFVPSFISGTDTQPTFLLALAFAVVVAFVVPIAGSRMFRITAPAVATVAAACLAIYAWLVLANVLHPGSPLAARIGSFLQFCAAALWAASGRFRWTGRILLGTVLVYGAFTVVYFATGGMLEEMLIRSRGASASAEFLLLSGRGARTLSPEPSFFALHLFNLFVLARLLRLDEEMSRKGRLVFVVGIVVCMASSFSAYAALLIPVVLLVSYPRIGILALLVGIMSLGVFREFLAEQERIRGIRVLLVLIESGGSVHELLLLDASFRTRVDSFLAYAQSLAERPLLGNGFSLYQGGGFISIVAAFGIAALMFFAAVLARAFAADLPITTKGLILVWFVMNFVSGLVGLPVLGVIVGKILASRRQRPRSAPARPDRYPRVALVS